MMKRYILIGANPRGALEKQHRGGVLSLSAGLLEYAENNKIGIDIIDTFSDTFENKKIPSIIYFIKRIYRAILRLIFLIRLLISNQYYGTIIFSGSGVSFLERILASMICKIFRVPVIFFIVSGRFISDVEKNIITKFLCGLLLKIPDILVASGKKWIDLFDTLKIPSNKVALIHSWVPPSFGFAENPKKYDFSRPVSFIFLGWIIEEKGIFEILSAIEKLISRFQLRFVFVGGGTLLDDLEGRIVKLGWEKFVSIAGWISDDEMKKKLLRSADVFVLPSYAEGFPMSLIEAMSLGLPAICTDVGGISDSLQSGVNGYLIPPRQVEPLIEAMEHYLQDPSLIEKHSEAALQIFSENHSQDENCKLIFQALEKG